ncbi:MAG: hypothetical protein JXA74_02080 [Anaerolineae bacterium]|nr:hypothetical protein [Anaerolineae bacterium]
MSVRTAAFSRPAHGWLKWVLLAGPLAVLAFLGGSGAPLGGFWAPSPGAEALVASATSFQVMSFMLLKVAEAVAFGFGAAFLLFGYGSTRAAPGALGRAAHLAIVWLLVSWWPHDSLHLHFEGGTAGALLGIEYGFHFTVMVAGAILAWFFTKVVASHR